MPKTNRSRRKGAKASRKVAGSPAQNAAGGQATSGAKDLLTLSELATYLGLSPFTVYQWRSRNRFPFKAQKVGRTVLVKRTDADAWRAKHGSIGRGARRAPASAGGRTVTRVRVGKGKSGVAPGALPLASHVRLTEVERFVEGLRKGGRIAVSFGANGDSIALQAV